MNVKPLKIRTHDDDTNVRGWRSVAVNMSGIVDALHRCQQNGLEFGAQHEHSLKLIMQTAPSGSGIDSGTEFDEAASGRDKLVFTFGYHRMNDGGFYDGWLQFTLAVTPEFDGVNLEFTTEDLTDDDGDLAEYLHGVYAQWLAERLEIVEEHMPFAVGMCECRQCANRERLASEKRRGTK